MKANGKKMSFADWMKAVDAAMEAKHGVSIHDLPDINYCDLYEDGYGPAAAAKKALRYAKEDDHY